MLRHHGIEADTTGEYVSTDLPGSIKFKANATYYKIDNRFNSRLDITVHTSREKEIVESFGDLGETIEEALRNNFQNFSRSSLHPLLAAFGCTSLNTLDR